MRIQLLFFFQLLIFPTPFFTRYAMRYAINFKALLLYVSQYLICIYFSQGIFFYGAQIFFFFKDNELIVIEATPT